MRTVIEASARRSRCSLSLPNLVRRELASEVPNHVIIPPHVRDGRIAVSSCLACLAGKLPPQQGTCSWPQRSMPVRLWQEVQTPPRGAGRRVALSWGGRNPLCYPPSQTQALRQACNGLHHFGRFYFLTMGVKASVPLSLVDPLPLRSHRSIRSIGLSMARTSRAIVM